MLRQYSIGFARIINQISVAFEKESIGLFRNCVQLHVLQNQIKYFSWQNSDLRREGNFVTSTRHIKNPGLALLTHWNAGSTAFWCWSIWPFAFRILLSISLFYQFVYLQCRRLIVSFFFFLNCFNYSKFNKGTLNSNRMWSVISVSIKY